jgi:hypothetical protein
VYCNQTRGPQEIQHCINDERFHKEPIAKEEDWLFLFYYWLLLLFLKKNIISVFLADELVTF